MVVYAIRRSRSSGRLTLRSTTRLGIAHFYFEGGKLVHLVGNRGDARATLADLQGWTRAVVRFEQNNTLRSAVTLGDYEQLFDEVLVQLQKRGIVVNPNPNSTTYPDPTTYNGSQVIEGHLIAAPKAERLLTPFEWRVLIEGIRRVSLAVAHLVGPNEAFKALRDILDDCSAAFPALADIRIAPSGYLQITDTSHFDRMPRAEILEGFTALIAICQHFCAPIIGEADAHKLFIQALNDVGSALVNLGVFQVNYQLLSNRG